MSRAARPAGYPGCYFLGSDRVVDLKAVVETLGPKEAELAAPQVTLINAVRDILANLNPRPFLDLIAFKIGANRMKALKEAVAGVNAWAAAGQLPTPEVP